MKTMAMGEFYVWYCEWCDSRNMTLWTRIDRKEVACACCQRSFPLAPESRPSGINLMPFGARLSGSLC